MIRWPAQVPKAVEWIFPHFTWSMTGSPRSLFLTFDDGPHPRITSHVLDVLRNAHAQATFFCIGDRVKQYPEVYARILAEGHSVGNHTHHHVNGWKIDLTAYLSDVEQASRYIDSRLFRPPYGTITREQSVRLREMGYRIVMWNVLSMDYDQQLTAEQCIRRVQHLSDGNIILFHDSEKAEQRMVHALDALLKMGSENGYAFKGL